MLIVAAFLYPKWTFTGSEAVLSWDVFGYYLYLPALFIYNDLGGVGFLDALMTQYEPAPFNYHAFPLGSGNYIMKYSMGQSIFYLPFFFIGHLWATFSSYPADGLSFPYQASIFWGAMCYALAGLWLMRKILLRYFSDVAVAVTLLLLIIATNYLNYVSFDGAMTHNHLFTMYAGLLYLVILWHNKPSLLKGIGIGFLCGVAALTRPTEIICVLLPLLWGVYNKETLRHKWQLILQYQWHFIAAMVVTGIVGSLQLIYWKYYSGHWLVYSYEDQGFSFLKPHLIDGLFSFKKGWLIYTPVMIFAILGLIPLYRRHQPIFLAVLIFSAVNIYITFSWDIWWYGGSFGARSMVQSYAVWLLPFAAFMHWLVQSKLRWLPLVPLVGVFIWLNLLQTYHCHSPQGLMHPEGLTKLYWYKAFVLQERGQHLRKFLDWPFEAPSDDHFLENIELLRIDPLDTTEVLSGKRVILSGRDHQDSVEAVAAMPVHTKKDWVRATTKLYYTQMEMEEGKMARLGMRFYKGGKVKYQTSTRLQWLFKASIWYEIEIEIPLTYKRADADSIAVYLENPGNALYADTIKLELLVRK